MQNVVIIIFLLIALWVGIKESMKHFRGEGGCCGGSSSKPKKKRIGNEIVKIYELHIEGMHCQNCVNTVTRAINDLEGTSAVVSLRKKKARVKCDREIPLELILSAIEKKGYVVVRDASFFIKKDGHY